MNHADWNSWKQNYASTIESDWIDNLIFSSSHSFNTEFETITNCYVNAVLHLQIVFPSEFNVDFVFVRVCFYLSIDFLNFYFCFQKSERYLPSFQTISYAIKSISQKFNWTEAIIFAGK